MSAYIEHITVSVTPHITVYTNGSRSTSLESNTLTKSAIVGGIDGSNTSKTYAKKNDITWTVGGATLTYPTSYIQYLGFSGAPVATDDGDTCADKTDAHEISLPATTDAASFIYALPANATALSLPTQLLQYLGGLDDLVEQFDGAALDGCAPLNGGLQFGSNESTPNPTAGNGSVGGPSGYAWPSSGIVSYPVNLPSGYLGASSSLPAHNPHASGYVGSSSSSAHLSSFKPTGYIVSSTSSSSYQPSTSSSYAGGLGTQIASLPVMSILPVSSGPSLPSSATSEYTSSYTANTEYSSVILSVSYPSSSDASQSSQGSTSGPKVSILPYPYMNTTRFQPSSYSETVSYNAPSSSSDSTAISITEGVSLTSTYEGDVTTSRTSTFTAPGGIFFPSTIPGGNEAGEQPPSSASPSTSIIEDDPPPPPPTSPRPTPSPPPIGGNNPNDEPPDDDGDDGPSTIAVTDTQAQLTTAPAETPEYPSSTYDEGENVHTTAFVIEPITGQALITYQSGPTKATDDGRAPGYTGGSGSNGGNEGGGAGGDENGAEPTQTANPDVSNLIDQIGIVADGGQDGSDGSPDGSNSPASDSPNAPGYDGTSDNNSPGQASADENSSSEISGSNGPGSDFSEQNSPAQDGGIDLGRLNSAINSVANGDIGGGNNGAQVTLPANADTQPGSVYSAGNTVVTAQPGGNVVIGEQTVSPGQSITIGSGPSTTVVALQISDGNTDLVVAGRTFEASPGSSAVTAQPDGAVVFAGSVVEPGQSVTIGSGASATVVELQTAGGSTNLVVGDSTVNVLPAGGTITAGPDIVPGVSSMALITTNGQTITAIQSGSSLILQSGGSTTAVAAGDAATFAGETILAVPTENAVFVNGNITPLTAAEGFEGASQAIITANGHTITAMDSGNSVILVGGSVVKTLKDGSALVFQGQTLSAQESGMAVVVNGQTSSLTSAIALATGQALVTADGHTFSVLDLPGYVVLQDGTSSLTIRDGATATFEGQKVTALANGDAVVVDGQTMSMTEPVGLATAQVVVTADGHTFTALDMDGYIVLEDGTSTLTVKDGSAAIFDGQTIRALSSGEAILVNGRTTSLTSVEASATPNLDDYINRGLSGGSSSSSQTIGAASSEPTDGADSNSAIVISTGWTALAVAGLFGIVAML